MNGNTFIYTIGYLDCIKNEILSSENVYEDLSTAIYDINYKILEILASTFDINVQNKFLFLKDNDKNHVKNNLKIDDTKSILFVKIDKVIDIYLCEKKNGYIYNSENIRHYFKFYINKHLLDLDNTSEITDNNIILNYPIEPSNFKNDDLMKELAEKLKRIKLKYD